MRELKKILEEMAVDEGYLEDWYINSVDDTDPVWTNKHIEELVGDFVVIPKTEVCKHMDGGWIPVEERLPENGESVLCTDGEYIYLVEYDTDLDAAFGDMDRIIAWKPLPEPYRPERSDNHDGE